METIEIDTERIPMHTQENLADALFACVQNLLADPAEEEAFIAWLEETEGQNAANAYKAQRRQHFDEQRREESRKEKLVQIEEEYHRKMEELMQS